MDLSRSLFKTLGYDSTGSCQGHSLIDISVQVLMNNQKYYTYAKSEDITNSVHNRNFNRYKNQRFTIIIFVY